MTQLQPFYQDVQAHYDLSDEFYRLFLDPTLTYSCAYFRNQGMTLEEAQRAKIDLSLGKCDLKPGMLLLDVGCGWGTTARQASVKYGANVIGLTLSRNQYEYSSRRLRYQPEGAGRIEIRLQGWEEFEGRVDRIVSIGAFEHFREERYDEFFRKTRAMLPHDGRMMLHTITWPDAEALKSLDIDHEQILFAKFIRKWIFPGGQLPHPQVVTGHAERAGFQVVQVQSLQQHYARTLEIWAANLLDARTEALEYAPPEVFDRYMHYLTNCAGYFRSGHIDVMQFTLAVDEQANRSARRHDALYQPPPN